MSTETPLAVAPAPQTGWLAGWLRAYHAYGSWLVSIGWWHFVLLSVLLLVSTAIAREFPPFSWHVPDWMRSQPTVIGLPAPPAPPAPPRPPAATTPSATPSATGAASAAHGGVEISIGAHGVIVRPAASAASGAAGGLTIGEDGIEIKVPPGADSAEVRQAIEEARDEIKAAIEEAREAAAEEGKKGEVVVKVGPTRPPRRATFGDSLPELAFLWIFMSAILKITYKGRLQAEVKAARAAETAEAETLKRQVVEARMAAMQAQVEPHFLFNTLASIDHLIETDPPRASAMQKNLIALLRASMPTLRESGGVHELGREIAVIEPYLAILKVRMEDRLATVIDVPEGLRSAQFPPMMIQSLVENAIKHGLEPKPEGGTLTVKAEIVHGKLAVSVADSGVGFGKAATAGTGIGLANIRERLALLYGSKASVAVTALPGGGTRVTITVPYVARAEETAST